MSIPSHASTVGQLGEHALIERITANLPRVPWVVIGPGDDAAVVKPAAGLLEVLTTDTLVDGVHFDTAFVPPEAIGHRALAANLSDLAAMGAEPRAALLSLALPPSLAVEHFDAFVHGFTACAAQARVVVVGGNITRTAGPWTITVTLTGTVRPRRALARQGARPGDGVFVTGWLGSAGVGLEVLRRGDPDAARHAVTSVDRYLRPEARLVLGRQLAHHRAATSCMDLSDGLGDGARQLSAASGVGMIIDAAALPISAEARTWCDANGQDPTRMAVSAGDDYELLFTVRPKHGRRLRAAAVRAGTVPITRIGVITAAPDVLLAHGASVLPLPGGFEHFR